MPGWAWLLIGLVLGGIGVMVWFIWIWTDGFKNTMGSS